MGPVTPSTLRFWTHDLHDFFRDQEVGICCFQARRHHPRNSVSLGVSGYRQKSGDALGDVHRPEDVRAVIRPFGHPIRVRPGGQLQAPSQRVRVFLVPMLLIKLLLRLRCGRKRTLLRDVLCRLWRRMWRRTWRARMLREHFDARIDASIDA